MPNNRYINFCKSFLRGALILAFFLVNTQFAFAATWTLDSGFDHRVPQSTYDTFETNKKFASGSVLATAIQSDGKIIVGGTFTAYDSNTQNRIARFNTDGSLDATFTIGTGFNGDVEALTIQSDGDILVAGAFSTYNGATATRLARLNSDGTIDSTFATNIGTSTGASRIYAVTIQSDGDILIGGGFSSFNGTTVGGIARLNSDGTIDSSFATATGTGFDYADDGTYSYTIKSFALQSDGDIIVGGVFNRFNGTTIYAAVARLNSDGTFDTAFNTNVGSKLCASGNPGTDYTEVAVQSDGKILLQTDSYSYQIYIDEIPSPCSTPSNVVTLGSLMRFNSDGTYDTDFVASGEESRLLIQSDGKILSGGSTGLSRFNTDGSADATLAVGTDFNSTVYHFSLESDGDIVVGGAFTTYNGTAAKRIARISSTGTLDTTFPEDIDNPYLNDTGFNGSVLSSALQSDGKIIVGGTFTTYNGSTQNRIARFGTDGTLDATFSIGTGFSSGQVNAIVVQSDGDIVAGGTFTSYNGTSVNRIIRLNSDGSVDSTFVTNVGTGVGNIVNALALQSDQKILIGTDASGISGNANTTFNGTTVPIVIRLNTSGARDTDFSPSTFAGGTSTRSVKSIVVQSDGKIIVGGANFQTYGGVSRNKILRMSSAGALDTDFAVGVGFSTSNVSVNALALQSDGDVVAGGTFTSYAGTSVNRIVRINSDGSIDSSFVTNVGTGANTTVSALGLQSNGKIIVSGFLTTFNGTSRVGLARLNTTGTLDSDIDVGTGFTSTTSVSTLAIQSNDKIIAGGAFTAYNGTTTGYLARLSEPDATAPVLTETTVVSSPTTDTTPSYTFTTDEAGTISYGGSCSSATTSATVGANTITFTALADGTYSNCTITVTDAASNASSALSVTAFTIDSTAPVVTETTPVSTPTTDTTPTYTFTTDEAGTITYGGSCSSSTTSAILGSNTVTFTELPIATHSNCTIMVTDTASNASSPLSVTSFKIENRPVDACIGVGCSFYYPIQPTKIINPSTPIGGTINHKSGYYISPIDGTENICNPFNFYMRRNSRFNNVAQVKLWQAFLNKYEGEKLPLTGFFGPLTDQATKNFQNKYKSEILEPWGLKEPTGYVYKSTKFKANRLIGCIENNVFLDNGIKLD